MEVLRQPSWWVPAGIFLFHQTAQYGFGWRWGLVDSYLDPLLFLPILLGLLLVERKHLFQRHRLTGLETLICGLLLAIIGEEVFPRLRPVFVRDVWDYFLYALGLAWFWWRINPRTTPGSPPA
ncbi:MAG: hypothetical protein AAF840_06300 [Bacteroidota bacterium]